MKTLSEQEKELLLKDFPKHMKLSYKNAYKKVLNYDLVYAIPEGKNTYIWFTHYDGKDICVSLEVNEYHQIENMYIENTCFHYELCFGTILYGTFFKCKGYHHFSLEEIFYYKGKNVFSAPLLEKLELYNYLFKHDITQIAYNKSYLVIALPIMSFNEDELLKQIKTLPYKVRYIEYRNYTNYHASILYLPYAFFNSFNDNANSSNKMLDKKVVNSPKNEFIDKNTVVSYKKKEIIFQVHPDIQNDIYHLYADNGSTYHSIAYIPDYNTSVKMNKLFRNIKENENLDALEESDEEDEFQNERSDKYVSLDKKYNMICNFSYKFKKWIPEKIAEEGKRTISSKELLHIEKNKY